MKGHSLFEREMIVNWQKYMTIFKTMFFNKRPRPLSRRNNYIAKYSKMHRKESRMSDVAHDPIIIIEGV